MGIRLTDDAMCHLKDSHEVSASHPKVEVMLWWFLMLSTLTTSAAMGCQAGEPVTMSES